MYGQKKVRIICVITVTLVLLVGCASSTSDPYAMIAQGQAALQATAADAYARDVQADGTSAAISAQQFRGLVAATATAQALNLGGTESAARAYSTYTAGQAVQAQATAQAVQAQSTQDAGLYALTARATGTRLAMLQTADAETARQAQEAATFKDALLRIVLGGILIAGVLPAGIWLIWRVVRQLDERANWANVWEDRRRSALESGSGTLVMRTTDDGKSELWVPVADAYHFRNRPNRGVAIYSDIQTAERAESSIVVEGVVHPALELMQKAIEVAGPEGRKIPGWRQMNVTSSVWQSWMDILRGAGAAKTSPEGTFLSEDYPTLYSLFIAMQQGKLAPTPKRGQG